MQLKKMLLHVLASPWLPQAVIIDAMFMIHTKPQSGEQKLHKIMVSSIFTRPLQKGCYPGTVHLVGNLKFMDLTPNSQNRPCKH